MAQWDTVLVAKFDNLSLVPGTHIGEAEPVSIYCPLTSVHRLWSLWRMCSHACVRTHKQVRNKVFYKVHSSS